MTPATEQREYVLITGDFVLTGGMDAANYALARYLANAGSRVHLVCYRAAPELDTHPNVRVHKVPKPGGAYMLGAPLLACAGRALASRALPRVVANGGNCAVRGVNWVHYLHAAYEPDTTTSLARRTKNSVVHRISLRTERHAIGAARLIIANSERTRRDIITRIGADPSRVHTVYYGIDPIRFRPVDAGERDRVAEGMRWPAGRPRLAFVGALGDRRKGFDVLFDAWLALCADTSWDAELVVIGAGAELAAWKCRAVSSGLGARIRFLGFRNDVPAIIAACDALVAPTRYEAFGLGVYEAACAGLPVIVSADAGVTELLWSDAHGLRIKDPNSAADVAARIRRWRDNVGSLRAIAREHSQKLRTRTWDVMAREIEGLLRKVE